MIRNQHMLRESRKKYFLLIMFCLISSLLHASCAPTTPWSAPINISISGGVTSNIFSAGTSAGFIAVWADSANNAHYSFSSNGTTWQSGLVGPAQGDVATNSDVFVAGNANGFLVTWVDGSNNGWSSFSTNNGATWSSAMQINPNTLSLDGNSDVYVNGGSTGFVATMIGSDLNAYASFSTGTTAWSAPAQVTTDGSVLDQNQNSQTGRGFVTVAVLGNSCMLAWLNNLDPIESAYFDSINPFSTTTPYPIVNVGFLESVPSITEMNGFFMTAVRANQGSNGQTYFSVATIPSNWATFSPFTTNPDNPGAGPWVAANQAGYMSTWVVGAGDSYPGSPVWTLSANNGFNWTPVCSILSTESTTIGGPVGLSANAQGFVATWLDSNDANAYASFYSTPIPAPTPTPSNNIFVTLLEQKYGPLL